jgi:hypothetical protein
MRDPSVSAGRSVTIPASRKKKNWMSRHVATTLVAACVFAIAGSHTATAAICEESGSSQSLSLPVKYPEASEDKQLYGGSYALIVGANDYRHWEDLPAVAKERVDLRRALVAQGFWVRVICDPPAEGVGGLDEIKRFLDKFAVGDNRVLVFISGHGWVDNDAYSGFFAAVDSPLPSARAEARKKGLGSKALIELAKDTSARHLMFVIDACYSAAIFTSKSADRPVQRGTGVLSLVDYEEISRPSRQFLTAGSDEQETPSPSIFTPAFILGISGFADLNKDGLVRESELSAWLRQVVANSTGEKTTPRSGYIPTSPSEISTGGGEMVFRYDDAMMGAAPKILTGGGEAYLGDLAYVPPKEETGWPDSRYRVSYYDKTADKGAIIRALDAAGIPYLTTKAILPNERETNALACHPGAPAAVVRAVARALITGGVRLRIIDRAEKLVNERRFEVQLLHIGRVRGAGYRDITLDDLDKLTGCQDEFRFRAQ